MKVKALTEENKFLNDWIKKNAEIHNGPQMDYFMSSQGLNERKTQRRHDMARCMPTLPR